MNGNRSETTSFPQHVISFCVSLSQLKSQDLRTSGSLQASLAALILTGIVCPFSLILNFLVLVVFYKKPSLRTQSNTMIGFMAVNDLVKAGIGGAFFMSKEIDYQMGKQAKCSDIVGLALFTSLASEVLVSGMNLEKFLALKAPYWHRVNVTRRNILISTFAAVFAGIVVTVIRIFSRVGRFPLVVFYAACVISTIFFAVSIWKVISKRNDQVNVLNRHGNVTTQNRSLRKAAKMATYIAMGLFLTNVIPLMLLSLIFENSDSKLIVEPHTQAMSLTSCLINPLIYSFMNQDIRKTCEEMVKCCKTSTVIAIQVQ